MASQKKKKMKRKEKNRKEKEKKIQYEGTTLISHRLSKY